MSPALETTDGRAIRGCVVGAAHWLAGLAALVALPATVLAEGRVELRTAGPPNAAAALEPVLRELLGRLEVTVESSVVDRVELPAVMTPTLDAAPAVARIWVDLGGSDVVVVHVVDGSWTRLLVRRVPVVGRIDEIEREEIGHILEAAVEALLAGRPIGEPWTPLPAAPAPPGARATTAPQPAARTASPDPRRAQGPRAMRPDRPLATGPVRPRARARSTSLRLAAGVGWEVRRLVGPDLLTGPGLDGRLQGACCARLSWLARMSGFALLPVTLRTRDASIDLAGAAARLVAGPGVALGHGVQVTLEVGPGIDLLHDTPRARVSGTLAPAAPRWTALAMGRACATVSVALGSHLVASATAGLDVDLTDLRFTIRTGGTTRATLDPPRVQPLAALGLAFVP